MGKNKLNNKKGNTKGNSKWIIIIVLWTIVISGSISLLSETLLNKVNTLVAFIILALIILIGVCFDVIGTAVTAGDEVPFHSMSSKKIDGAATAVKLVRNADKVSNFCNDVIGDICGIISGSVGLLISKKVCLIFPHINSVYVGAFIGAIIASMTVGGKAIGKNFAINNSSTIVFSVSKIIHFIKKDRDK